MITIVTDTAIGYSRAEAESRGVRLVSLHYSISGIGYDEQCRGENGNFLMQMRGKLNKTSQPTPEAFAKEFADIVQSGGEALCITLSAGLSGTYSSATLAAKEYGERVRVINSGTVNGGMHLLVDEAVNMVVGGMQLDTICAHLEDLKRKIGTVFTVETLEPLRKGGRLTVKGTPDTTLNSRPILDCDEKLHFITNVRGGTARVNALVKAVPPSARRIFLMKSGENTDTRALELALGKKFPNVKIHLRIVGPVLTVHLGEGAMGVAYISK